MRIGQLRVELLGIFQFFDRSGKIVLQFVGQPEVVMELYIVRRDRKSCPELLDGMVNVVLLQVSSAHVFAQSRRRVAGSLRPLIQLQRAFGVPGLHKGQPIVGQDSRVLRLLGQDIAKHGQSPFRVSGILQSQRQRVLCVAHRR